MQRQSLVTSSKQNDDQPVSEQMVAFPKKLSSQFYCWAWYYMMWNILLVSLSQLSSLCPLQTPEGGWEQSGEKGKTLTPCKYCWTAAKTLVCHQICFSHMPKTHCHMSFNEENLWQLEIWVLTLKIKSRKQKTKKWHYPGPVRLWYSFLPCVCHHSLQLPTGHREIVGSVHCFVSSPFLHAMGSSWKMCFPWVKFESERYLWRDILSFYKVTHTGMLREEGEKMRISKFSFSLSTSRSFLGYRWERQLVFRSKLTMHTAFDRKDNAHPAEITALGISKWVACKRLLKTLFQWEAVRTSHCSLHNDVLWCFCLRQTCSRTEIKKILK